MVFINLLSIYSIASRPIAAVSKALGMGRSSALLFPKRWTLGQRLVVLLLPALGLCAAIYFIVASQAISRLVGAELDGRISEGIHRVADTLMVPLRTHQMGVAFDVIDGLAADPAVQCVQLDNGAGDVLYRSGDCFGLADARTPHIRWMFEGAPPRETYYGILRAWPDETFTAERVHSHVSSSSVLAIVLMAVVTVVVFAAHNRIIRRPIQGLIAANEAMRRTGQRVPLHRDAQDEIGDLIRAFNDVLEDRDNRQQWLARKSALLTAQQEASPDGLVVLSTEGQVVSYNGRFLDMFGLEEDAVRAAERRQLNDQLLPQMKDPVWVRKCGDRAHADPTIVVNDDIEMLDGRVFERRSMGLVMSDGKAFGRLWTFRDVTERRVAEARLAEARDRAEHECTRAEEASAAKTRFLRTISHELRTPLNAILGFSQILSDQAFGPMGHTRYVEYARDIRSSGQHLLDLISDILTVAEIDSGRIAITQEAIRLSALLSDVAADVRQSAHAVGHDLSVSIDPPDAVVLADRRALGRLLLNMLSGGIKSAPLGGRVVLSAALDANNNLHLSVTDGGDGAVLSDRIHIYGALEHLEQCSDVARPMPGLGLSVARELAELHGGTFSVDDTADGGAAIRVVLPSDRCARAAE